MAKAAKTGCIDLLILIDEPVVGDDQHIMLARGFSQIPHNERTIESTCDLLPRPVVRVIPESSCIIEGEAVPISLARLNGGLRQIRNAIHFIDVTDTVPVNCCGLVQIIDKLNVENITLSGGDKWSRTLKGIQP